MDWSCHEEDGVMRPFKAKCLDGVCCNGFTRKILYRWPLAVWHTLLRPWPLMGWKGVSNQSVGSRSVEATLDPLLVLQCFCRDLFEEIWFGMGWPVAFRAWRWGRGGRRRWRWWPRFNRSQGVISSPLIGIVPCKIGGYAGKMMLGECEPLRVAVAKERK